MSGGDNNQDSAEVAVSGDILAAFPTESAEYGVGRVVAVMATDELGDEVFVDIEAGESASLTLWGGDSLVVESSGGFQLDGAVTDDGTLFSAVVAEADGAEAVVSLTAENGQLLAELAAPMPVEAREAVLDIDATVDILMALESHVGAEMELNHIFDSLGLYLDSDVPVFAAETETGVLLTIQDGSDAAPSILLSDWDFDGLNDLLAHHHQSDYG
ncbi:MAG: hypothetical protein ACPGO3_10965 [Magnetospiraceae bacterium]